MTKKALLQDWRIYLRNIRRRDPRSAVSRDFRSYTACTTLCEGMVAWLSGKGAPPTKDEVLAALRRPQQDPRFYGAIALQALAMFDPDGPDTLMKVFRKATLWVCQSIMYHVRRPVNGEILDRLIGEAARHKLPEVRRWAIQFAYHNAIPSFDRLMARRKRLETDKAALSCIDQYVSLRRDGYHARYLQRDRTWDVRFHCGDGLVSQPIPKSVVDELGLPDAIECCRAALSFMPPPVPWGEIVKAILQRPQAQQEPWRGFSTSRTRRPCL